MQRPTRTAGHNLSPLISIAIVGVEENLDLYEYVRRGFLHLLFLIKKLETDH